MSWCELAVRKVGIGCVPLGVVLGSLVAFFHIESRPSSSAEGPVQVQIQGLGSLERHKTFFKRRGRHRGHWAASVALRVVTHVLGMTTSAGYGLYNVSALPAFLC